jgi:hypothetical protein
MKRAPHSILGVARDATAEQIRAARRELARRHHPDAGGDPATMQRINAAAGVALSMIDEPGSTGGGETVGSAGHTGRPEQTEQTEPIESAAEGFWVGQTTDTPSFTVEALPAEAFEALLIASDELGEICDDDPPYGLVTKLDPPVDCWCRLDIVPDAGASTVGMTISALEGEPLPSIVGVRNAWIDALNSLDWSRLEPSG